MTIAVRRLMQTTPAEPSTGAAGEAARGSLTLPIAASVFSTGFGLAVLGYALDPRNEDQEKLCRVN
jgi:hypothetical protein